MKAQRRKAAAAKKRQAENTKAADAVVGEKRKASEELLVEPNPMLTASAFTQSNITCGCNGCAASDGKDGPITKKLLKEGDLRYKEKKLVELRLHRS